LVGIILDTNGNGKRDAYTEPDQPADPTKDRRMNGTFYGVSPASDGSVWGTIQGVPAHHADDSRIESAGNDAVRILRSAVQERESLRFRFRAARHGHRQQGRVWTVLSSGQLASFDAACARVS